MNYIDTVNRERTDLDLHIDLCAQRYAELDRRLNIVETKVDSLSRKIDDSRADIIKVMIATLGTSIASVAGMFILVLTKMP